ncbi:MAG: hypothetical protein ACR2P7_04475 [bacterium]
MRQRYGGLRLAVGGRDYRFGGRYRLDWTSLKMGLEAYRKQRDAGEDEHGVLLRASLTW